MNEVESLNEIANKLKEQLDEEIEKFWNEKYSNVENPKLKLIFKANILRKMNEDLVYRLTQKGLI